MYHEQALKRILRRHQTGGHLDYVDRSKTPWYAPPLYAISKALEYALEMIEQITYLERTVYRMSCSVSYDDDHHPQSTYQSLSN